MLGDYSALIAIEHVMLRRPASYDPSQRFKQTFWRRIRCAFGHHGRGTIATGVAVVLEDNIRFEERGCLRCGAQTWTRTS